MNKKLIEQVAVEVTKELTDRGKLIEAGFAAFAYLVIPDNASSIQRREMQFAFMAGAEHVFSSILTMLDPGDEPTAADERRMELVHEEIDEWRRRLAEYVDRYPAGRA